MTITKLSLLRICGLICLFCIILIHQAQALRIVDWYKDVSVGQWIELESNDGLITKTKVIQKHDGLITLHIISSLDGENVSDSEQVVDINQGKVISIKMHTKTGDIEIDPSESDFDEVFRLNFEPYHEEEIIVNKGTYMCQVYRTIYDDRIVRIWVNQGIPVLHMVQLRMQSAWIKLRDFGTDGDL
ncbi:MAG: hypothetical protein Q8Q33_00830 [Chlamydiota bacterium]|nr:hypothetical protein [Chlamydiota bacterium]